MTKTLSPRSAGVVLAYLDPASWAVGSQLVLGAGAWAWLRIRRALRGFGLGRPPEHEPPAGLREVAPLAAAELLAELATSPRLVFVIEGPRDWPYLASVAEQLAIDGIDIWCVSAGDVPLRGLGALNASIRYVAHPGRAAWTLILSRLSAEIVLTTLTDLGSSRFPKSTSAYYAYVFHSLVSTHVAYPADAFDGYDALFCPGSQHVRELVVREQNACLAPRIIAAAGYPFLDDLCRALEGKAITDRDSIVLAPSWSSDDQLTGLWTDIAYAFRAVGWRVNMRPHAETIKRSASALDRIAVRFADDPDFKLDLGAAAGEGFAMYAAMVTDWSGAAIEFALSGCGPVAFVDTPRKVRNFRWREISEDAVEIQARAILGVVIPPSEAKTLPRYFGVPGIPIAHLNRGAADLWTVNNGTAAATIAGALRSRLSSVL